MSVNEAKCTVCGQPFPYAELYCMKSGRGATSQCSTHEDFLICQKCGGFKNGLVPQPCPFCGALPRMPSTIHTRWNKTPNLRNSYE